MPSQQPHRPAVERGGAGLFRYGEAAQQAWWIVDESYHHFTAAPMTLKSELDRGQLIILRSLTKDMALAGLRLGYALAAPALIDLLRRVQPAWSVNVLAQVAGIAALQPEVLAWRDESLHKVQQHARQLWSELSKLGFTVLPTSTPYSLVQVGQAAEFRRKLLLAGVLVRDCTSFGLPDFIRIAARRPEENERLLAAIQAQIMSF
ncbi:MAG: aminotransferase class I/II-fold pyridoxal phosphate-dependent enzyme [Anaerolineae bacterium]